MTEKLALLGGDPVRAEPFPWDKKLPNIGAMEEENVKQVLQSKNLSPYYRNPYGGEWVQRFERAFARIHEMSYRGEKTFYAIACDSGTAALHIAYAALGIGCGDEIIVPAYTFIATATAALHHNAIPIFADCNLETFNMEPHHAEPLITDRTKAITIAPMLGNPCDMGAWTVWLEEYNKEHNRGIKLVEDTAQSLGATYATDEALHMCGTFGDIATFSFQHTKIVTTGEGGMVLTDNYPLAERCRLILNHGETRINPNLPRDYRAHILGWNYRMRETDAAIGCAQLYQMPMFNQANYENGTHFDHILDEIFGRRWVPQQKYPLAMPIYSLYGTRLNGIDPPLKRDTLINALAAEGITATKGYPRPIYHNAVFMDATAYGRGCPFKCWNGRGVIPKDHIVPYDGDKQYKDYIKELVCSNAEQLCQTDAIWFDIHRYPATLQDMKDIETALQKLKDNLDELYAYQLKKENPQ